MTDKPLLNSGDTDPRRIVWEGAAFFAAAARVGCYERQYQIASADIHEAINDGRLEETIDV